MSTPPQRNYFMSYFNSDEMNIENEKQIFKRLPEDGKIDALYEILSFIRSNQGNIAARQASADKNIIEIKKDVNRLERDNKRYREIREQREKKVAELLDTSPDIANLPPDEKQRMTDKFLAILNKSDERWLPVVRELLRIIIIVLGIIVGKQFLP